MELMINNVNGNNVVSSRTVAEQLGKEHAHILRDIREKSLHGFGEWIIPNKYTANNGQTYDEFLLTKDGLKQLISRYNNITPEQYKTLGIDDIDVVYNHTRFEISFGNMLEEYLNEFDIGIDKQFNVDGYRVDFYIPSKNICVEYDEQRHFIGANIDKDLERQKYIEDKIGCKFIRCDYRDSDIKNLAKVMKEI
ncbi:MAG: Rha family transcriptional regulator [Fusobacteriaceae bacterium]